MVPEPLSTAAGQTVASSGFAVVPVVAFGVQLGLRADVLVAGFLGAVAAIILANTVPSTGDTWRELVRTSLRRIAIAAASSFVAGYMTPIVLLAVNMPEALLLGVAFVIGFSPRTVVAWWIRRTYRGRPGETMPGDFR